MKAITHFRTERNGAFTKLRPGQQRGYWRTLVVYDPAGSLNRRAHNVHAILITGRSGINGVTERSSYYIDDDAKQAQAIADEYNTRGTQS